jgi:peptide/nickel transport system permease protein
MPVGIYAAIRGGSAADYGLTIFSYLGLALPNFLLALILLYFANRWFGADIGGLFSAEYKPMRTWSAGKIWDLIKHLWLPAVVLAWSAVAYQIQTMRATMSDELNRLSVTAGARPRAFRKASCF